MHLEDVEQSSQDDISFAKLKCCPAIASKVDVPPENERMSPEKRQTPLKTNMTMENATI